MHWHLTELLVLVGAGLGAGAVNAAAGGGALIIFPILVATGLPALTANLTNTVAQCPGYASIAVGYRSELTGQGSRVRRLLPMALAGGVAGIALLKLTPAAAFRAVIPGLILMACLLLALQPRLAQAVASNRRSGGAAPVLLGPAVIVAGAYAAYFGAAAGVLLLAILGVFVTDALHRLNALNRLLILAVNLAASVVFALVGPVNWSVVVILAPTTLVGGHFGVRVTRQLNPRVLRAVVLTFGVLAAGYLFAHG